MTAVLWFSLANEKISDLGMLKPFGRYYKKFSKHQINEIFCFTETGLKLDSFANQYLAWHWDIDKSFDQSIP